MRENVIRMNKVGRNSNYLQPTTMREKR